MRENVQQAGVDREAVSPGRYACGCAIAIHFNHANRPVHKNSAIAQNEEIVP